MSQAGADLRSDLATASLPVRRSNTQRRPAAAASIAGVGGDFAIWAMFRDTVGEGDGDEVVLHEYAVEVRGAATAWWARSWPSPWSWPFLERPAAAGYRRVARRRRGLVAWALAAALTRLIGVAACTHLNDLLRALGGVGDLLARPRGLSACSPWGSGVSARGQQSQALDGAGAGARGLGPFDPEVLGEEAPRARRARGSGAGSAPPR